MSVPVALTVLLTAHLPAASDVADVAPPPSVAQTGEAGPTLELGVIQPAPVPSAAPLDPGLGVGEQLEPDTALPATPDGGSEIVVTGRPTDAGDPLEKVNAQSFKAARKVDGAVVRPVAIAYKNGVPEPVRDGLFNFFSNLHEPVVAVNYLLQLKPGKALETAGRFLVNSTVGALGLFDVARKKPFRLPRRPNGLADTLGYYGVKPGPFFYLPLVGPTTLRDSFGNLLDGLFLPTVVGKPFTGLTYTVPSTIVRSLNRRVANDERMKRNDAAADPYRVTRDEYLQYRQDEIDNLHRPRQAERSGPIAPQPVFAPAQIPDMTTSPPFLRREP